MNLSVNSSVSEGNSSVENEVRLKEYLTWKDLGHNLTIITYDLDTTDPESEVIREYENFLDFIHQEMHRTIELGGSCYLIDYYYLPSDLFDQLAAFLAPKDRLVIMHVLSPAVIRHYNHVVDAFQNLSKR